jgi:hypothetical protein
MNVYILDHLIKKELKKKGERMCALFVDFKEAFEKVDSEKMFECMRERERGISEWLVRKIEEIYANKVKVGEKECEWFETTKGVRQGCPLNPSAIYDICAKYGRNVKKSQTGEVW